MPRVNPRAREFDVAIGRRVRERRMFLGITQLELAKEIDVVFQQMQKYETGRNSLRMWQAIAIARRLGCGLSDLIDGLAGPLPRVGSPLDDRVILIARDLQELIADDPKGILVGVVSEVIRGARNRRQTQEREST